MKEIAKIKTVEEIWYEASDGSEFQDKEQCERYEKTVKCALKSTFKGSKSQDSYVGDYDTLPILYYGDTVYAVIIETPEQIEKINEAFLRIDGRFKLFGEGAIGTIQLIVVNPDEDYAVALGTPEELKKKYCKEIDALFNKLVEPLEGIE